MKSWNHSLLLLVGSAANAGILRKIISPSVRDTIRSIIPCIVFQKATSPMYAPKPIRPSEFPKKLNASALENMTIIESGVIPKKKGNANRLSYDNAKVLSKLAPFFSTKRNEWVITISKCYQ